jgi:hypothetical protein
MKTKEQVQDECFGEVYTLDEFIDEVTCGGINQYDGVGFFHNGENETNVSVWEKSCDLLCYPYVCWYNIQQLNMRNTINEILRGHKFDIEINNFLCYIHNIKIDKNDYTLLISRNMYLYYSNKLNSIEIPYIVYDNDMFEKYVKLYIKIYTYDKNILYIDSNMILLHEKRD